MYMHGFLCGVAVTLLAVTVALLIAEAVLKRKIRDMKKRTARDAVEVVRCKDCKHRIYSDFDGCYVCHHGGFNAMHQDNFCSYGERKDND